LGELTENRLWEESKRGSIPQKEKDEKKFCLENIKGGEAVKGKGLKNAAEGEGMEAENSGPTDKSEKRKNPLTDMSWGGWEMVKCVDWGKGCTERRPCKRQGAGITKAASKGKGEEKEEGGRGAWLMALHRKGKSSGSTSFNPKKTGRHGV